MNKKYFDIYCHNNKNQHRFCYRSGDMVYEEAFLNDAFITQGWNSAGYPLDVLCGFPSYINHKRYAEPFAFNLEIDGESLDFGLDFVDYSINKTEENQECVITLKSIKKPVTLRVHTLIDGTQMLSRWIEVENTSESPLKVSRLSVLSGAIESLDDDALEMHKALTTFTQ
jgi:hypothetical protein